MKSAAASILVLSLVASWSPAAELVVRNLNLSLELLPTDFDYTLEDGVTSRTGSDGFERHIGMAVGGGWSFAGPGDSSGLLVGGQLVVAQATYESVGNLTTYGLRAVVGYGWQLTDHWGLSINARGGYRLGTFDITASTGFPASSQTGGGLEYGGTLGLDYAIGDRWLVTADVGWLSSELSLSGSSIESTLEMSGGMVALGVSYRFSSAPRPLE